MLQRKRPCQTQAWNNRGQPWGNRAICMQLFAVSRPTKANQKNLNGGWQASTNAFSVCLCKPRPICLPSKNGPVFFFCFWVIKHSSSFPKAEKFARVKGRDASAFSRANTQNRWTSLCTLISTACTCQMAKSQHQNLHYFLVTSPRFGKPPNVTLRMVSDTPICATVPLPISGGFIRRWWIVTSEL